MTSKKQYSLTQTLSKSYRALAQAPQKGVSFTQGEVVSENAQHVLLPHLPREKMPIMRGMVDFMALKERYDSKEILQQFDGYHDELEHAEAARVEVLTCQVMKGVQENLAAHIAYQFDQNNNWGQEKALYLWIKHHVFGEKLPKSLVGFYREWAAIYKAVPANKVNQLHRCLDDGDAFLTHVFEMLEMLAKEQEQPPPEEQPQDQPETEEVASETESSFHHEAESSPTPQTAGATEEAAAGSEESNKAGGGARPQQVTEEQLISYEVFTREFDETALAEKLYDWEEIRQLSKKMEHRFAQMEHINQRQGQRLLRQVMASQQRQWHEQMEEGRLNNKDLSKIIADPHYNTPYKKEVVEDVFNTTVTLLLDNSGSMRGRPITIAAMSSRILAKLLEEFGIPVEILGFTTVDWKGGKSRQKWQQENSPTMPGRLNDLRHIIYKPATMPWAKAKYNLGLMLKEGLLKENIDGEAIIWAYQRLMARPQKRKILLVVSDGAPVDDSTISANNSQYLEQHLQEVVRAVESEKKAELLAIGIGHDVSRYYSHAIIIKEADQLGDVMLRELAELLKQSPA